MTHSFAADALSYLTQGQYAEAVSAYEQAIEIDPDNPGLYWGYGIALVFQNQEDAAQSVWMSVLLAADNETEQQMLAEQLVQALSLEAERCEGREDAAGQWILRRYQCEFAPDDPISWRELVIAGLEATTLSLEDEEVSHFATIAGESEVLFTAASINRTGALLHRLLSLNPAHPTVQMVTAACVHQTQGTPQAEAIAEILGKAARKFQKLFRYDIAVGLIRYAVQLAPTHLDLLEDASDIFIVNLQTQREAIEIAERMVAIAPDAVTRLRAMDALMLKLLTSGGQVQQVQDIFCDYKTQLLSLVNAVKPLSTIDPLAHPQQVQGYVQQLGDLYKLMGGGLPYLYFADEPETFRPMRNQLAMAAQAHTQTILASKVRQYGESHRSNVRRSDRRPLRIGYLADTFRQHSVGWLCRWLLKYHDRDRVEVHLYTSTTKPNDFVQTTLLQEYGDRFHCVSPTGEAIANQIFNDEIDILVELDGMTEPTMLVAASLKPAPIQVSWLGFDASGLPAVDYFIADPYVLPSSADDYYQEKIWRLPQTYIAVDGFEVHTPTLHRCDLNIPDDAIVYLSSQAGFKRNPDNVRLQLQILNAVPNSYFLIKSLSSDPEALSSFFYALAEEVGVEGDRLRFLPDFPSEFTYRANLQLADVVLDTYPYNGATTTLEALWMGLPIVTRVGQQFAARNSYTMLMNVGISEGIAWSDEEYVEWGVRLGQDEALRRDVVWRLHQSRQSAPLWDAKRFAQEMENAYEHMWHVWRDRQP